MSEERGTPSPPVTGAQFGKYRIVRRVGEGAFGAVFEAVLPGPMGFSKRVAIKCLRSHLADGDPRFADAMADEARIGGLLHHANIVDVFEFGQVGRYHYLAMEYVDGATLAELIALCRRRGLVLPRFATLDIVQQVCRGLHYAHQFEDQQGRPLHLVHRDLKPSNIILDRAGTAKVLDFGIAKAASNRFARTRTGVTKGTPQYMSPEQLEAEELTPASDLFSLGVILFEMITGRALFTGNALPVLISQILYADTTSQIDEAEALLPGIRPILVRALQRDTGERYACALEMGADLRRLSARHPHEAEMSEVMVRLLPAMGRTQDPDILTSGDLDLGDLDLPSMGSHPQEKIPIGEIDEPRIPVGASSWGRFTGAFSAPTDEFFASTDPTASASLAEPLTAQSGEGADGGPSSARQIPAGPRSEDGTTARRRPAAVWAAVGIVGLVLILAVLVGPGLISRATGPSPDAEEPLAEAGGAILEAREPERRLDTAGPERGDEPGKGQDGEPTEPDDPDQGPEKDHDDDGASEEPRGSEPKPEPEKPGVEPEPVETDPTPADTAPAPPEPTPPPPESGRVVVAVKPWARVSIDGEIVDKSLVTRDSYPVSGGPHTVRLVWPATAERAEQSKQFDVQVDGDDVELSWNLHTGAPIAGSP